MGRTARLIAALAALLAYQACAAGDPTPAYDTLVSPDRASALVFDDQKAAYDKMLHAYDQMQQQRPADVSVAIARCTFIQRFAWSEDLTWTEDASKDLETCRVRLEKQFPSNADASLFNLEHRFGKDATTFGEPLVAQSTGWTAAQRARLHSALSRAYALQKNDVRAGEEAVLAAHLDPASDRVVEAVRYLAKTGKAQEAANLLATSAVPKSAWQEGARINVAVDALSPAAARDELQRADEAGLKIAAYTRARVLQRSGDSVAAQAALSTITTPIRNETPQMRQLRLDVALDARDAKPAADVISDQYSRTRSAMPLASAYAHLLFLSPRTALRVDLLPVAIGFIGYACIAACLPGLFMFVVHYRGVVRLRKGKPSAPLFARIGLRHAWYALGLFSAALTLVMTFRSGTVIIEPTAERVGRVGWERGFVFSYIWSLLIAAIGLAWVATRITWREWWGQGPWKPVWLLAPAAILSVNLLRFAATTHAPDATHTVVPLAQALVQGAKALGGQPLAIALLCVAVPVIEELVFRGCLLGGLSRHISFGWSNVIQAGLFASMHQDGRKFLYLYCLAFVAGWLVRKTRGLAMPILLHAVNNAVFLASIA
jgi:CAAX protease family protein